MPQVVRSLRRAASFAVALLVLGGGALAQNRELIGIRTQARVVSVIDGDTVDAVLEGERRPVRIRLEGVDAPERGESFSDAARRFARVLLFDKRVEIEGRDVDRYGRLVARVLVGSRDSSLELVTSGLACHYTAFSADPRLAAAETDARSRGVGFWALRTGRPRCAAATVSAPRGPAAATTAAEAVLHGNTSSHVYHAPYCRNYNCRNCTRPFASAEEARAAGFRPAGDCLGQERRQQR
jgi:endonuclease YncB( thermonuclease family)